MVKLSVDLNEPKDSSKIDKAAQNGRTPKSLTLEIHHGGWFTPTPIRSYIVRQVSSVNVVNIDEFCLHDLKDMVVKLGYGVEDLMYFYFLIPSLGLDYGLHSLNVDADVLEMSKPDLYGEEESILRPPLSMPKPPCSRGPITLSQAIQAIFFVSELPPQKKFLRMLSNFFIMESGALNPQVGIKEQDGWQPMELAIELSSLDETPILLLEFTSSLEARWKQVMIIDKFLALGTMIASSANWRCDIGTLSLSNSAPRKMLLFLSFENTTYKASNAKINRKWENGSPCLIPLSSLNSLIGDPLMRTEADAKFRKE
ncbi:hypothetical protein Tco_0840316 [Tanacetum coccineum]|uniref:PB1-like domain-containing protein n=1 Tax=Tanacetum coccineum TaxID=301880 RepID=A0ABQ5AV32_9ASTR